MSWHESARKFGLGRFAYHAWHRPAGAIARSIAAGGPVNQWIDARGRCAMERAAVSLPASSGPPATHMPELHFLTGRKFWYQTAFCLYSLQRQSGFVFRAVFHDDGSLDAGTAALLRSRFPSAELRFRAENDDRVASFLPPARFPTLHFERQRLHPNILKLIDVHAGARGWRLVLDSDMLFFRKPDFLLGWLRSPDRPAYMLDLANAYGYSEKLMAKLAGAPIPPRVNVGLAGLLSDAIDWEKLEFWSRRLIEAEGSSYYIEQALVAMLLAGQVCAVAPAEDYVLAPSAAECRAPRTVLQHYVGTSKRGYFRHAWRRVLEPVGSAA